MSGQSLIRRKRAYFLALPPLLVLLLLAAPSGLFFDAAPQVALGGRTFDLELAITPAEQRLGLSGRASLPATQGMLFIYKDAGFHRIWMRDMNFSIDVLWINSKGVIEHIERSLSPETYPKSFTSANPSHYVLEVNAGAASEVEVGGMVYFSNLPMPDDAPNGA